MGGTRKCSAGFPACGFFAGLERLRSLLDRVVMPDEPLPVGEFHGVAVKDSRTDIIVRNR
jgi:hypothetical protein